MKSIEQHRKQRIKIVGCFFICFFAVICVRVVYLQVFCRQILSRQAADQYERSFVSQGKRGTIYDRNHKEMAVTIDVTSVAAYPPKIKDVNSTAIILGKELRQDTDAIAKRLKSNRQFAWVKRQITPGEAAAVRRRNLSGIDFIPEYCRFYPNRTLAAQLLGFTGIDGHGLEGIEFYYDAYLKGDSGEFTILKDALGRAFVKELASVEQGMEPSHRGNNLILTIDRTIQFITEKALRETTARFSAKRSMAVVMDPRTGAILALANYPLFNPNDFQKYDSSEWRNRIITDSFEPGSTMKIFCAAAALESGACTPNTIFYCENGAYKLGDTIVHDIKKHGWLSLKKIVKFSSNIGAVKISEMIGPDLLYRTLRDFGFGDRTGIDCPGETPGSVIPLDRWSSVDAGVISYGHGIAVSAVQLISAVSAIANGGTLMKPYVVQAVTDSNGGHVQSFGPCAVRRVISENTAVTVRMMMYAVVEEGGTGQNAALEGYTACGKTGTAQKPSGDGAYSKGKYLSSFVGFAPAEKPEIAVLVIVDEPEGQYYGGIVAAPAFKQIVQETLHYLNVRPNTGADRLTVSLEEQLRAEGLQDTVRTRPVNSGAL